MHKPRGDVEISSSLWLV